MTTKATVPATPGKILKSMEWLTVPEAARELARELREDASEADVLRFALNGLLTLSVRFVNHAVACRARKMLPGERSPVTGGSIALMGVADLGEGKGDRRAILSPQPTLDFSIFLEEGNVTLPAGVYDLPMWGAERLDVEREYERCSGGPAMTRIFIGGAFVESSGEQFQLLDPRPLSEEQREILVMEWGYAPEGPGPCNALPADSVLVVRKAALAELEVALSADPTPPSAANPASLPTTPVHDQTETLTPEQTREGNDGKVGGRRLAAWLKARLMPEGDLTINRLHVQSGLDRKTIKAVLSGKRCRRGNLLRKLADGLKVPISVIPTD